MTRGAKINYVSCLHIVFALVVLLCYGCSLKQRVRTGLEGLAAEKMDQETLAMYNFSLARLYVSEGDYENAVAWLNKSLSQDPDSPYLHRSLAETLALLGRIKEAEAEAAKAVELNPKDADNYAMLGYIYLKNEEPAKAETILKRGRVEDPKNEELIINLVDALLTQGKTGEAVQTMREYLALKPDSTKIHYYLGQVYLQSGEGARAEMEFRKALETDPSFYPALRDLRNMYVASRQYGKAVAVLNRLLEFYPTDVESRSQLVMVLTAAGRTDQALAVLEEGKSSNGDWPDWWIQTGRIYMTQEQYQKARLEFEDLLARDPENQEAHFLIALIDLHEEKDAAAQKHLEMIPLDSPLYPEAVRRLAYLYYKNDQYDKAVNILQEAIKKYPAEPALFLQLSDIYISREDYEQARQVLNQGLANQPDHEDLLYQVAMVSELMGEHETAIAQMKKVLRLNPNSARALNFIGYTMADNNLHLNEAEEYVLKALDLEPNAAYIQDSMGWVYYRKGELQEALFWLNKAYEQSPDDPEINEHLGDLHRDLGNKERAREFYQRALEQKPRKTLEKRISEKLKQL